MTLSTTFTEILRSNTEGKRGGEGEKKKKESEGNFLIVLTSTGDRTMQIKSCYVYQTRLARAVNRSETCWDSGTRDEFTLFCFFWTPHYDFNPGV